MPARLLPSDLGLDPLRFPDWREGQDTLASQLALSPHRFPLLNSPCGSGKSVTYIASSLLSDSRLLILTPNRALQDQLATEFPTLLIDVRGQSNYSCPHYGNCEIGAANECALRRVAVGDDARCSNLQAIDRARQAPRVVSNLAFWMTQGKAQSSPSNESTPPPGIGRFDQIVIDEGHRAPVELAKFCTITLLEREVENLLDATLPSSTSLAVWSQWARETGQRIPALVKAAESGRVRVRLLTIGRDLADLSGIATDHSTTWIFQDETSTTGKVTFTPVWATAHAERLLFQGTEKVILTSATLLPTIGEYLGIPSDDSEYIDVSSGFDPENGLIYYTPTVKVWYKNTDSEHRQLAGKIDQIMDTWKGYRGLIHSQSFRLTEQILKWTRNRTRLIVCESGRATEAVQHLKRRLDDKWVIGPALKEGHDLPDDDARVGVIANIPLANKHDPVTKARCESNPHYEDDLTAQDVMQMVGRLRRSRTDWSRHYIPDMKWGFVRDRAPFPASFRLQFRTERNGIPGPPRDK